MMNLDASAMRRHAASAARLMRALSNRHRLLVLCALSEGELSVGDLNARVALSQSALSQHLAVLRREELVTTRREGQTIYYAVTRGTALEIVALLHDRFCGPSAEPPARPGKNRRSQGALP